VDDLGRGGHRVHAPLLEHEPDTRPQRRGVGPRVEPEHPHLAGVRAAVALAALDRRGLAGTVGAEQPEHLSGPDVEGEPVDGERLAVPLGEATRGDDGLGHDAHLRP
jgi:hypothetical protein